MENQEGVSIDLPSVETIISRRNYIPGLFGITILFFFLNFCEFSCQGQRFAAVSGINLVTGTQISSPKADSPFGFGGSSERDESRKMPGSIWAGLALLAAATGLAVFLMRHKKEDLAGTVAGAIGAVSLLLLQTTLSASIREEGRGVVSVHFLLPYWGALLALAAAGTICFLRSKKGAPQAVFQPPPLQNVIPPPSAPVVNATAVPSFQNYTPQPASPPIQPAPAPELRRPVEAVVASPLPPPVHDPSPPSQPPYQKLETSAPVLHERRAEPSYRPPAPKQNSWLIGLVIVGVSLIIAATAILELRPEFLSEILGEKSAVKDTPAAKTDLPATANNLPTVAPLSPADEARAAYVQTLKGSDLRLREGPSETSKVLTNIPNKSTVIVIEYYDRLSTVNGEKGRWCMIKYQGKTGWAWGKFIIPKHAQIPPSG